ncbi:MAG: hypothetical protein ACPGWS_01770 [Solirubrobacterales bacterium]
MASLLELAENGTLTLTWRAVGDARMCDDCRKRHGAGGLTLAEWQAQGLPGTGWSICRGECRCILLPDNVLSVDAEFDEPFSIGAAVQKVDADDPIEASRVAVNIRLMEEFRAGQRVKYDGPVSQLRGFRAVVRPGVDPVDGLWIDFEHPPQGFPEFASLHISDFSELVRLGE